MSLVQATHNRFQRVLISRCNHILLIATKYMLQQDITHFNEYLYNNFRSCPTSFSTPFAMACNYKNV